MRNLIVNADDLGWSEGVNRGIAEAHRNGIVTSASLLANGCAFASAVEFARATPGLGVGVHLNLSDGPPCAARKTVTTLLTKDGNLAGGPEALLVRKARRGLDAREVECEWHAQIERVKSAGIAPTHLDGHKHVHMLPGLFPVAVRLAKYHGIPSIRVAHEDSRLRATLAAGQYNRSIVMKQGVQARGLKLLSQNARGLAERAGISTPGCFCGIAQTGQLTREGVAKLLRMLPAGTTELMCHPGFSDEDLRRSATRLTDSRRREVAILTDPDIRKLVASEGIRLVDYGFVAQEA
jgi:predicted glycoside hydrolase/deacetylase ChbG (UPF0249 family)